jgi:hypothetical protein
MSMNEPWAELTKAAMKHKVLADLLDLKANQLLIQRDAQLVASDRLFRRADELRARTLRDLAIGELACTGEISDADVEALQTARGE